MDNKELLKELESLKKRISQLESQKKDNLSMFGRSYSQIGDSNSDFLIKTKGQVKIQWGSKFIDIIKDGKLNVNTDFIFTAESADKLGVKDGLYIVSEDSNNSVYLKLGDNIINLAGEAGNTYVSFLEEQETTSDQKHQALVNAGFLHETLDSIDQNSLQNGIIYIESEQKLYTVVNGTMTELGFTFPNPFTDQFVIAKTDNKEGAILIKGTGIENSLAFESLLIYTDTDSTTFESDNSIVYNIGGTKVLSLSALSALFNIPITSSKFQSLGANEQTGFRLYMQGGSSYLEVDNLILRNQDDPSQIHLFPEYWLMKNNIILKAELVPQNTNLNQLSIELTQSNEFNIGEIVAFYTKTMKEVSIGMQDVNIYDDDGNIIGTKQEEQFKQIESYSRVEGEIVNIENNIIIVNCFINLNENQVHSLSQQFIYLIKSSTNDMPIKIKDNNIDIVEYSDQKDENGNLIPSIESRFGNLEELGLLEGNKEESIPIKGHGIFSKQGYFEKARYIKEYNLPEEDNSSKMASTEWVRKLINSIIPIGTIIAYHGDPSSLKGWHICNGQGGTPDLTGKFIKAGTVEEEGGEDEILLKSTDIPLLSSTTTSSSNSGAFAGQLIPTFKTLEEFVVDQGGSSNYCLYTGKSKSGNGLKALKVDDLPTVLDVSSQVGTEEANQTKVKIEPKYYSLIFIMKIE